MHNELDCKVDAYVAFSKCESHQEFLELHFLKEKIQTQGKHISASAQHLIIDLVLIT